MHRRRVLGNPRLPANLVAQARRVDGEDEQVLAAREEARGREGDLIGAGQVDEPSCDEGGIDHCASIERNPPLCRAYEVQQRLDVGRGGHFAPSPREIGGTRLDTCAPSSRWACE